MTTESTTDIPDKPAPETPEIPQLLAAAPAEEQAVKEGLPEAYEAFTLPEGLTLDGPALEAATVLFRKAGLDQATAQQFVDLAMGREQAQAEAHQQRHREAFANLQHEWVGSVKADPEIGGAKLAAGLSGASRVIDRLGVPGLREALHFTGAGNHPAVVKAFVRLGQMLAEDRFQPGGPAAAASPRSPADVIYAGLPRS